MGFDDLKGQPPRTAENSRFPEAAISYGNEALLRSKKATKELRKELDVAFGDDYYQKLDVYFAARAAKRAPVFLFFHGGAWAHGYKEWNGFMAPAFVDTPAIFVSASYRLVPQSKWPDMLDDALSALNWVYKNADYIGADPNHIIVGGWSAGGTLASLIALRKEQSVQAGVPQEAIKGCLVTSTSFMFRSDTPAPGNQSATYRDFLFRKEADQQEISALNFTSTNSVPFFIAHGQNDFPHVVQTSSEMAAALKKAGTQVLYHIYPGDHYSMNLSQGDRRHEWVKTARDWISRR